MGSPVMISRIPSGTQSESDICALYSLVHRWPECKPLKTDFFALKTYGTLRMAMVPVPTLRYSTLSSPCLVLVATSSTSLLAVMCE